MDVHDDAGGADRRKLGHRGEQLVLQRLLDPAGNRQSDWLAARRGVGQLLFERALDAGIPAPVDVGVADDMGGEAGLRIKTVGLAIDRQARVAQCVDRFDQGRRGASAQIEKAPADLSIA